MLFLNFILCEPLYYSFKLPIFIIVYYVSEINFQKYVLNPLAVCDCGNTFACVVSRLFFHWIVGYQNGARVSFVKKISVKLLFLLV